MLGRMQEQWNISYRLPAVRNAEGGIIGDAVRGSTVAVAGGNAGTASLAARAAGADVTHLDSVRQVVTWARHNMEISSLVACAFGSAGRRTSGELVLRDDFGRILPLSVCIRLER